MAHLTLRMAWHDAGWDGTICRNPAANSYCTGSHSLLSDRLAREKRTEIEAANGRPGAALDVLMPEYLPPCYWTSAAFSPRPVNAVHRHPFSRFRDSKTIEEQMPPYSAMTWPFRLSLTHSAGTSNRQGKYFADLEARIERYQARLSPRESIVFFYLNYDNPVSADDGHYAVVGCAVLSDVRTTGHFPFDAKELGKIRADDGMQNFPTLNWALRVTCDFADTGVRLPYQEYLRHIEEHPEDEWKLEEMRVLVEEPSLLPSFKYVSEQLSDDQCLALLYKLRHAFVAVDRHGIAASGDAISRLDNLIAAAWARRGLYPGLGAVIDQLCHLADGAPGMDAAGGKSLVEEIRRTLTPTGDLLDAVMSLLETPGQSAFGPEHAKTIRRARRGFRDRAHLAPLLRTLSLFCLTPRQVGRILSADGGDMSAFGGREVSPSDLAKNPYLLCESYVSSTEQSDLEAKIDRDREMATDSPIDYFAIDVGMFPDETYIEPNESLQCLGPAGPERLRAFVIESLRLHEERGHTFASLDEVLKYVVRHPLFHRDQILVGREQLLSEGMRRHFSSRIHIEEVDEDCFFYLAETWAAERTVERVVKALMDAPDHVADLGWVPSFVDEQAAELASEIPGFDAALFRDERRRLFEGALTRRLFVVTGRPGSGKTRALRDVLRRLEAGGDRIVVLAPTGKATLRLKDQAQFEGVQTIDRWIFANGLGAYLDDLGRLDSMERSGDFKSLDSLVIDEMSMVDLPRLAVILRALEVHQPGQLRRIILVGDEHQLPPVGCGRPFDDLVTWLRSDLGRERRHTVRLRTNCRQKEDDTVIAAAHLFAGKNRYATELWGKLLRGGAISKSLTVERWRTQQELNQKLLQHVDALLAKDAQPGEVGFNLLLGLYDTGFVPGNNAAQLTLDRAQILAPYRAGHGGALVLNDMIRRNYRSAANRTFSSSFCHSDKIIRISNYYAWNPAGRQKELRLSNGSFGVLCKNKEGPRGYFPESNRSFKWKKSEEDEFELAYAITVHKGQGSEFRETFVVIPERRALLTRELVYTAFTRSQGAVTIFVQEPATPGREHPLAIARERSALLSRNSSIFGRPQECERALEPEAGVRVMSKVEYLIYRALVDARSQGKLMFSYEAARMLPIGGRDIQVHPDYTIQVGGRTFYWEHLGMLDREDYASGWRERRRGYESAGLIDQLVTTDDLAGVRHDRLLAVIGDLVALGPQGEATEFSQHHYRL